ncbi:hypothetical protein MMC15_008305 [Xylographa vitiligo]|nr:hypothetical protein [Xylographa vitiligo]
MRYVLAFTERNSKHDSDKLPAISAITRHIQTRLESSDEYILELWKRYLHQHVLWQLQTNFKNYESFSNTNGNRPSWSWISVNGTVYNHRTNREAIEKTTCLVTLTPRIQYANKQDHYGDAVLAELDATGLVVKVALRVFHSKAEYEDKDFALIWLPEKNSDNLRKLTQHPADLDILIGTREKKGNPWFWAYCLFVAWESFPETSIHELVGLLLCRLPTGRGLYHRIGRFSVKQPECGGLLEEIRSDRLLDENDYLERNVNRSHKITVML